MFLALCSFVQVLQVLIDSGWLVGVPLLALLRVSVGTVRW